MITSAPQLLHKYSFSDTTKTGPEDFCAWKLFAKNPDSSCYAVLNRDMCYCNDIRDKGGGSQFRKMQLKMAVAQIKLLRNKRHAVVKQLRRDIALLLQFGQDATA
ncbi:hypothetical protein ACFX2A_022910 [Malus domestica]